MLSRVLPATAVNQPQPRADELETVSEVAQIKFTRTSRHRRNLRGYEWYTGTPTFWTEDTVPTLFRVKR